MFLGQKDPKWPFQKDPKWPFPVKSLLLPGMKCACESVRVCESLCVRVYVCVLAGEFGVFIFITLPPLT